MRVRQSGGGWDPWEGGRTWPGWRLLVPGGPQWAWGQRQRSLVLLGWYVSGLVAGLMTWGTLAGWGLLAWGVGAHVVSVADAIRQAAFPAFAPWVPWSSSLVGVGLGGYAPLVCLAWVVAWPGLTAPGARPDGYLVNRGAYWSSAPQPGDWVWLAPDGASATEPRVVRVLAGSGQWVEWARDRLRVGGAVAAWTPARAEPLVRRLAMKVPDGYLLVDARTADGGVLPEASADGLALVAADRVGGRAWARLYPVWERGLLL